MREELKAHTIILPSYCPVMICATKAIAEEVAKVRGYNGYVIRRSTARDIQIVTGVEDRHESKS